MAFGAILRASIDDVLGADVPLLTSGAMTHRLAAFGERDIDGPPLPEALAFREWMRERLEAGDRDALAGYRTQAPHAAWNHPTDEHLLPLFVAAGAGGWPARCLHASWEWGMLAMDAWQFGD